MDYIDVVLGANESSDKFHVTGYCDVIISGLTSGAVKLQYLLHPTAALPIPAWTDFPEGSFSENTFKTIYLCSHGVYFKFVGVANNAGVYVKIARGRDE